MNTLPLKRKMAETKQNSLLAVNLSYVYRRTTKSGCNALLSQKEYSTSLLSPLYVHFIAHDL